MAFIEKKRNQESWQLKGRDADEDLTGEQLHHLVWYVPVLMSTADHQPAANCYALSNRPVAVVVDWNLPLMARIYDHRLIDGR